jgi:hypothetical protein
LPLTVSLDIKWQTEGDPENLWSGQRRVPCPSFPHPLLPHPPTCVPPQSAITVFSFHRGLIRTTRRRSRWSGKHRQEAWPAD